MSISVSNSAAAQRAASPLTSFPRTPGGLHVRFLSQNRPGQRMGMGHYERLLIQSLLGSGAAEDGWRFDIRFAGRGSVPAAHSEPGLTPTSYEGYSPDRLARLPWTAARTVIRLSHRLPPPDLYHSLSLAYPAPGGRPAVYTIHDLPPARFPDEGALPGWAKQAARAADAIVTPSEFAKRELIELLELPQERVHVVPNGYERDVFHADVAPADTEALAACGIPGSFLLYSGGFTRRKNVSALLEAWGQIAPKYPETTLALAGPTERLKALAAQTPAPRVVIVGYVERDFMPSLLKAATALVYPSIYEGFGLPPLEAMALGIPVIAVHQGAVPEVTGDCAVLADDGTPDSLAAAIQSLLENPTLAKSLSARGPARANQFSWETHALQALEIYRGVCT